MSRLADYFVVVGVDRAGECGEEVKGKVIQRFPVQARKDAVFPEGIELFCQPGGWYARYQSSPETFFVSVLTDMEGDHKYCACFTFYEPYTRTASVTVSHPKDDSLSDSSSEKCATDGGPQVVATDYSMQTFVPKCLCLVSRVTYFDILKNCLTTIYLAYISGNTDLLERLVGTILGFVQVPPPGGPKLTFSIGAGDRQTLCPPSSTTLPVTGRSVVTLVTQLGIHGMLCLLSAVLTESKILFMSSSYTQLTNATQAMLALMYPLNFSYVYIPILPAALLDFLSAPTPFIMGVHGSYKESIPDLADVIVVDIDGGHISIPDSTNLAMLPEPFLSKTRHELSLVLNPHIVAADYAFHCPVTPSPPALQDKELRAICIRLLAKMFSGYRSSLTLIRIHPKPVITFNKASFMAKRGFLRDDFLSKVLDSISFTSFVALRGPPYRPCDLFDELCAEIDGITCGEGGVDAEILANIQQIAQKLFDNEPSVDLTENSIQPNFEDLQTDKKAVFPKLNSKTVSQYIKEEETLHTESFQIKTSVPLIVPCGNSSSSRQQHYIPSRKLEVLKDCVTYIFENKISEARKALPSVLRALKSKGAQLALCHELSLRARNLRSVLEHDQFDLVVRLMNSALQDDSSMNNTAVAMALLPLTATFCRKLAKGVIQFAYTCVQEHPVWQQQSFWEEAFYTDVESQIKQLYAVSEAPKANAEETLETQPRISRGSLTPQSKHRSFTGSQNLRDTGRDSDTASESARGTQAPQKPAPSALDIAANQLKKWPEIKKKEQQSMVTSEESIVYSQAIHYANRMVYMRIPLNVSDKMPRPGGGSGAGGSASGTHHVDGEESVCGTSIVNGVAGGSIAEVASYVTDSGGWESLQDECEETIADDVSRFVLRFVDRVGTEAGISTEHMKSLYAMIPGVVAMHIESLEPVYREYKQLAPIRKAKIMRPALLQGEEMQYDGLRCYAIPDGRDTGRGGELGGPSMLPADGAVFLTNYRVIFKGTPIDQYASEMIVTRSFPVGSLLKEKKIGVQYLQHLEQWLHECLQLRSSTFQLMKLVFDEEVGVEAVEAFKKKLQKLRAPPAVFSTFAFCGKGLVRTPTMVIQKHMERQGTMRKNKTRLMANATRNKVVHIRGSLRKRGHKRTGRNSTSPTESLANQRSPSGSLTTDDEEPGLDPSDIPVSMTPQVQGIDRLSKMPCCNDYTRLGFGSIVKDSAKGPWRISMVNFTYTVCRSYPAVVVVPQCITDDTILRVAKNHRSSRFPVAVWKHQRTKAVLLRAGAIERSMTSFLRPGRGGSVSGHGQAYSSSSAEEEKVLAAVVSATPLAKNKNIARANSLHHGILLSQASSLDRSDEVDSGELVDKTIMKKGWEPAALYVFGDKSLLRNVKQEAYPKCEFIPVELPDVRAVRACFKKFQRACCPSSDINVGFHQQVHESEWLQQLSAVMNVANAVVDLVDIQGSSVLICFEDGWDVSAQVLSLAELMLDPYYRTMEGFQVLIEKEWLAFGHKFTHRGNQVLTAQSGFTPIFLQFLDAVHQIMLQFPLSFEFNDHFLCTLAYHHVSMRFRTFLMDSEHERYESGWLSEEEGKHRGKSLWDYIEAQKRKAPLYHNFLYAPSNSKVLRSFCRVSNLKVWKYYTTENLFTGPMYDLELINEMEHALDDEPSAEGSQDTLGRCMSGCYGDVTQFTRDECSYLLQELSRLEDEADQKPRRWEQVWHKLEYPPATKRSRSPLAKTWADCQRLNLHKRSTMEAILRGKLQLEERGAQGFSQPHNFVTHTFVPPANCDYCYQLVLAIISKGLKCTECGYNCHEKCQPQVPWQCKKRDLPEQPGTAMTKSTMSLPESEGSGHAKKLMHCGFLFKRGHLLRQWKSRWFVLDTQRNQLRYYDSEHDTHCQGFIDLGDMISVSGVTSILPGAPKHSEKGSFFDLRTTKRVYNLMAETHESAKDWVEKLHNMTV